MRITPSCEPSFPRHDSCWRNLWRNILGNEDGESGLIGSCKVDKEQRYGAVRQHRWLGPTLGQFATHERLPSCIAGDAGHDLRQPLQVVQSAYEWLGSKVIAASERTRLERGESAIEKLREQLDTLIRALRLNEQTHGLEITPVELAPVLSKIGLENEDDAWEKGIELRVSPTSAMVMSDAVLLEGALRNLVRNAFKYRRFGGRILIGCRRTIAERCATRPARSRGIAPR